jgi:HAD superfamily hydrolase (TIGR01484 family)
MPNISYLHVFFDLDKTLTKSRSAMEPPHQELFEQLCAQKDVVVVTGGSLAQIREQVTPRFDGRYFALAQSGNEAIDKTGAILWLEKLNDAQVKSVEDFIPLLQRHFGVTVKNTLDVVENRGAQISMSVLGFHANIAEKYAFDPDESKRALALKAFPEEVEKLRASGIAVEPAGTTVFNFIPAGKHKGFNITRFIGHLGWKKEECVYVGDALFPGGNDSTVIGVIPTHAVKDPDDTFRFIKDDLLY